MTDQRRTSGGVVLTEELIDALVREAERGICTTCKTFITAEGWCDCFCLGCGRPRLHMDCDFGEDGGQP